MSYLEAQSMDLLAPVFTTTTKKIALIYSRSVHDARRRLLVFPAARRGSQCIDHLSWVCEPPPHAHRERTDEFGNRVLELYHTRIVRELNFAMTLVTHRSTQAVPSSVGVPEVGLGAFLLPSALADGANAIRDLMRESLAEAGAQNTIEIATALCGRAHASLCYRPGSSHVGTTASQALARGEGVCQDYAHLMTALCRAAGLPARYVSGYNPAEGLMHAWVEVLCDSQWLAWDPTHNRRTGNNCVFVACGRDFRDVTPVRGTYVGGANAKLTVHCRTRVTQDAAGH